MYLNICVFVKDANFRRICGNSKPFYSSNGNPWIKHIELVQEISCKKKMLTPQRLLITGDYLQRLSKLIVKQAHIKFILPREVP